MQRKMAKKWKDLESSEKHQMQRQSSTQIGNGMPNRQRDISECTSLQRLPQHCGKGKNKAKTQTNLDYIDKTQLGQYELQVDYQVKIARLKLQKCHSLQLSHELSGNGHGTRKFLWIGTRAKLKFLKSQILTACLWQHVLGQHFEPVEYCSPCLGEQEVLGGSRGADWQLRQLMVWSLPIAGASSWCFRGLVPNNVCISAEEKGKKGIKESKRHCWNQRNQKLGKWDSNYSEA